MLKMNVFLRTYGCQMNKLDSALVTAALKEAGFKIADNEKDADAVLINTCSVREHAEERVFSHLGHLKHIKESRPELVVGVFGCMAQGLAGELLNHPAVDIVCGPAQIPQLAKYVKNALSQKRKQLAVTENIRTSPPENPQLEEFESVYDSDDKAIAGQAFVRVMHGCNNLCSYCIVPYVRGPEVSRPPARIIEQIKRLAAEGIKQVTLLGQAVNFYKYKAGDKTYRLSDILEMVNEVEGIEWIRFVTNYPAVRHGQAHSEDDFVKICEAMRDLPKVCHHLHMPAQSGSDKILKAMNRKYTARQYLDLIETAKEIVSGLAVASDFIVGFPGETEEDFQATVDLVKKARYRNCFIFKYSPRPDTAADKKLQDNVPVEIKKRRNIELLGVQEKISDELSQDFLGRQVEVLVEGLSKKPHLNKVDGTDNPQLVGRTATDYIVVFNGPEPLAGEFAKVKITKTSPLTLFGELL